MSDKPTVFICQTMPPAMIAVQDAECFPEQGPLLAFTIYDPWEKSDVSVYLSTEQRLKLKDLL